MVMTSQIKIHYYLHLIKDKLSLLGKDKNTFLTNYFMKMRINLICFNKENLRQKNSHSFLTNLIFFPPHNLLKTLKTSY